MSERHIYISKILLISVLLFAGCGEVGEEGEGLDAAGVAAFVAKGTSGLLEFGGKRCISCMEMRRNLTALMEQRPSLRVGYVYWEEQPELLEEWGIEAIPVQIIIDADGREVTRHTGVWEVEEMEAALSAVLPQ